MPRFSKKSFHRKHDGDDVKCHKRKWHKRDDDDGCAGRKPHRRKDRDEDQDKKTEIVTREIDGTGMNGENSDWGAAGQELLRLAPVNYADGLGEMRTDLPNPREISNELAQAVDETPNSFGASDLLWAWGQFIDHDLDLTEASGTEFAYIPTPSDDPVFAEGGVIPFTRVVPVEGTGEHEARAYENEITAVLDASMVYGSDAELNSMMRDSAYLLLDEDDLLLPMDEGLLAGDVRAAENVALTSLHTILARNHNHWVDELTVLNPDWTNDQLFDAARMRVEAEVQAVTYNEFLPILVGEGAIAEYEGYDASVNPGISVEFSTAAYRFGHSLLSPEILRVNEDGSSIAAGSISLQEAFFNPDAIAENGGVDPILRGLAASTAQELDTQVVEDVRSFLFAPNGEIGLDLASINIQRGRDLGVASYNDLREAMGLERVDSFSDITSNADIAARLEALYGDVDLVDAWVGGLAEDPAGSGMLGETFAAVIIDQFTRIRDGDALWSEAGQFSDAERTALWETTLADLIERNTSIESIQNEAFYAYQRIGGDETDNIFVGSDGRDLMLGAGGDDRLEGGAGDDQLEGGDGDDTLIGGAGNDMLYGGAGADVYVFNASSGFDTIGDFDSADTVLLEFNAICTGYRKTLKVDGDDVILRLGDVAGLTFVDTEISDLAGAFSFA